MNSMLANDATTETVEKRAPLPPLETWAGNDRMRHVPPVDWMIRKVDQDLRKRLAKLTTVFAGLASADPRHAAVESELRALCRSIECLADAAKPSRHTQGASDLPSRIDALLTHAVSSLRSLEPTSFGRRYPSHTGERSKSEPVYAALLTVITRVEHLVPLMRAIDAGIDERLLEGLVVLENPVDDRMLRPIA